MILCHKCAGVLTYNDGENTQGLLGCSCISGWVRGFEPNLTRKEAILVQIQTQEQWAELYRRQGRSQREIDAVVERWSRLVDLL